MPKAWGYGRHSTDKQGLTEEAQREKVEAYIKTHLPDCEYGGWIYDSAVSGKKPMFEREQGRNLLTLAQPGDHLVWAKLDRAFRSVVDGAGTLAMLAARKVYVHSLDLGLDTSTAIGRCISTVMLAFAELEREYASDRTREAMQVRKRAGRPNNGVAPVGWKKIGKKASSYYAPDTEERAQVDRILQLRSGGMSYEEITIKMRGIIRPSGRKWNHNSVRLACLAARRGFPKVHVGSEEPAAAAS